MGQMTHAPASTLWLNPAIIEPNDWIPRCIYQPVVLLCHNLSNAMKQSEAMVGIG
jgi:hypothetical protein